MKQVTSLMMMLVAALSSAQLPSHRQTDWHHACSKTSFSNDTVYFSSFLKNEVDSDKAIEDALAFTAIKKGTLLIDKGTFYFSRTIQIPADVNIAGQGSENTHLVFNLKGNGHLLQIMGNNSAEKKWITTDAYRGETAIQVAANHNFNSGDWIKIGENNDELITSNWAKGSVHQIVQIKTVQGNTLLLNDALRLNISAEKQAYVALFNPKENIALSGFHIIRQDKTIGQTANIFLSNATNISIKNIQSDSCNFAHIQIEESSNVSINGCYLKTAFDYGNGGKAYGVALQFGTGNCLIENNIFARLRHSVLLQAGVNGNVIGYNYSREPFWTETQFPSSLAGDIVLHGNAPFLNLFEGNICQNIVIIS